MGDVLCCYVELVDLFVDFFIFDDLIMVEILVLLVRYGIVIKDFCENKVVIWFSFMYSFGLVILVLLSVNCRFDYECERYRFSLSLEVCDGFNFMVYVGENFEIFCVLGSEELFKEMFFFGLYVDFFGVVWEDFVV